MYVKKIHQFLSTIKNWFLFFCLAVYNILFLYFSTNCHLLMIVLVLACVLFVFMLVMLCFCVAAVSR